MSAPEREPRVLGLDAGTFVVPDDFDVLPDDVLTEFETTEAGSTTEE